VLALAAMNAAGTLAFGLVYAAAAARILAQPAFLAALALFFAAVTVLWVRVERSHGHRHDPVSRLARIAAALVLTLIGVPGLALAPLFALNAGLPAEAGLDDAIRPVMVLLLISLSLVALVNLAGSCFIVGSGLRSRLKETRPPSR
jgi:hypothetical protein